MADIAQIGFAADTSGLAKAETALEQLTPAAAKAEQAAGDVASALADVSKSASTTGAAVDKTSKVMKAAAGGLNDAAKAASANKTANDNAANSHRGLSTQAMAAQHSIRSMVEQLAMGVPVTQVFSTQLNHLSYAASGPGGITKAFSEAFGALTKLFSGTALVITGIVALAAGFAFAAASVIKSAVALDDLSKAVDTPLAKLHALQQAASFKGISTDEFSTAIEKFSGFVDEAQHNTGTLNGLMIASGKSAKTLQDYLANVADLVAKTASGTQRKNIIEAAGLPVTAQWVRFLSQGGDAIRNATNNTTAFNDAAEKDLIAKAREFDDMWNKATTNLANNFKSAIVTILAEMEKLSSFQIPAWMKTIGTAALGLVPGAGLALQAGATALSQKPQNFADRFGQFNQPTNAGALQKGLVAQATGAAPKPDPKTAAQITLENQQYQQKISLLGDLASVQQIVTSKQKELDNAALAGVSVTRDQAAAIKLSVQAQTEQTRVMQQAQAGVFDLAKAQKAAADTLQDWINKGLVDKNNVTQMAAAHQVLTRQIEQTRDAAAVAAAPLQQLKQLELDGSNFAKQLDTTLTTSLNNLVSPIQDVLNGVTSLSDGFKNAGVIILKAIQEMIIKMTILAPIAKGLQGIFGGFGIGGGSAASALASGTAALAKGGAYNTGVKFFGKGGSFTNSIVSQPTVFKFANGTGMMGEAGPEAIMPLRRGNDGSLGVQMYGGRASNDNGSVTIVHSPQYNIASDVSKRDIQEIKKAQEESNRNFTGRVAQANSELRKRNRA